MIRFFEDSPVLAFISDAAVDFTPPDFDSPLTQPQRSYVAAHTGMDVPQVFWRKQVHGDAVLVASQHGAQGCPDADAFITNQKDLPLAIRTADCVPVFIYDPHVHAIGLAHAGWKGTEQHIAAKTLQEMQDKFSSRCYDLNVVLGPSIRSCCYEVGKEFKTSFPKDIIERDGKLYVDVVAANRRQLLDCGVPAANIVDCGVCTYCNPGYFSFRRDGEKAGRMISLLMLL